MTTYRSPYIRGAVLRNLGEVAGEPRMRYAQVIGIITALLDDDRKMVEAIRAACYEKRKEYSA